MNHYSKLGFTLIELLVVITLLGILALISFGAFQGSQKRTRDTGRKQDLVQIAKGLEMYANDRGEYPASDGQGRIVGCTGTLLPTACTWGAPWVNGSATYMPTLPKDPTGGTYCYQRDTIAGKWYKLYAKLEGTDDSGYDPLLSCGGQTYTYVLLSPNITPTPGP